MGTVGRLYLAHAPVDLEGTLRARLAQLEARWSRFIDSSEVSAVNAAGGLPVRVSEDTRLLFTRAVDASRRTHGWFDPMLLNQLCAAGYDRPFGELDLAGLGALVITPDHRSESGAHRIHDWNAVCAALTIDAVRGTVAVPAGTCFDPGGIGKGLAADLVLSDAIRGGAAAALVDLGGDIATAGRSPDGGWSIALEDPFDACRPAAVVRIPWGAVATSSKTRRRWRTPSGEQHHLIDPGTGRPSASDVVSASVIAGTCWQAEAYAKAAVLAGTTLGLELLESGGVEGVIIDDAGGQHPTRGFGAYLEAGVS